MNLDKYKVQFLIETVEAKERELEEEEAILKAMQRGELPQGDE